MMMTDSRWDCGLDRLMQVSCGSAEDAAEFHNLLSWSFAKVANFLADMAASA